VIRARWLIVGAAIALALATLAVVLTRGGRSPAVDRDLERLGSSDGLYTAPQIKAQLGFSLPQTAYAYGALNLLDSLGDAPGPSTATIARLHADLVDGPVERGWQHLLLHQAGLPVASPGRRAVLRLWKIGIGERDAGSRVQRLAELADLSRAAELRASQLPPAIARRAAATYARTRGSRDPAVERARAELARFLHLRADADLRDIAGRRVAAGADAADRVNHASAIVEAAAAVGHAPAPPVVAQLITGTSTSREPEVVYVSLHALRAAGLPTAPLRPVADDLRRRLGASGAIAELATFPEIPKAVWLVAHIRRALGEDALPEPRTVRLSQLLASPDPKLIGDADDYGVLLAAARLAQLSYSGPGVAPVPVAPLVVKGTGDSLLFNLRARVAADLEVAPKTVTVQPWRLRTQVDIASVGALLHTARLVHAQARVPPSFTREFLGLASATRYSVVRWSLYSAAGLADLGRSAEADAVLRRDVRIGCRGYPHLVADHDGTCDLESTLLLLELRRRLPTAGRLAREVTGE
jgi:hypothetical protein